MYAKLRVRELLSLSAVSVCVRQTKATLSFCAPVCSTLQCDKLVACAFELLSVGLPASLYLPTCLCVHMYVCV